MSPRRCQRGMERRTWIVEPYHPPSTIPGCRLPLIAGLLFVGRTGTAEAADGSGTR